LLGNGKEAVREKTENPPFRFAELGGFSFGGKSDRIIINTQHSIINNQQTLNFRLNGKYVMLKTAFCAMIEP